MSAKLAAALKRARACRLCAAILPHEPRPVVAARASARLMIVGQAPGTRVHATGLPFNDRSGDRLRDWLGIGREVFYDPARIAIMPMGLCFPGQDAKGGDKPPIKICAPTWHPVIRPLLPAIELTLLVGFHAQRFYLRERARDSLTETVRAWRDYGPDFIPLPHPSWRNTGWLKRHKWFADEIVPELRRRVATLVADQKSRSA